MINVWVLFILTHGGWYPIMEVNDEATCQRYVEQYSKTFHGVECKHLSRRDGIFRPEYYGKHK